MPSLSIVIPAYNEHDRLDVTLASIADAFAKKEVPGLELAQVIVADDGSTDDTSQVGERWKGRLPITVVRLARNSGKGAAVRAGMGLATGDFALMYDADGAAPIREVGKLFAELQRSNADISIGSRVFGSGESLVTMAWHRRIIGRVYHFLGASLVPGIRDTACGCKLYKKEVAARLFSLQRIDRFAFDIETLAIALKLGYTIVEVPLQWTAVPESKVRIVRDGIEMLWCLIRLHLSPRIRRLSRIG